MYMLEAIEQTSIQTSAIVRGIKGLMMQHKKKIRTELPKIYSQDLINNLFKHPYTKIDFVVQDLQVTRKTAAKYLHSLCDAGFLSEIKIGKEIYFLNNELFQLLANVSSLKAE